MVVWPILSSLIMIFILIVPGVFFKKKNILTEDQNGAINSIVVNLTWPCLVIDAMQMKFSLQVLKDSAYILVVCLLILAIIFAISFPVAKLIKLPKTKQYLTVFMLLFGINFNLYYFLLLRHFREALASEELHVYLGIVAFSTLTITANIAGLYDSVGTALRTAFFQVSSIVTTTGYATVDFNLWPTYSRVVIVILTFVGACAGSTAGGLKVSRVIIFFKAARQDLNKMLHSHAVTTVRFEGKPLDEKTLRGVHNYFNIYIMLLTLSVLLVSLDGFDVVTTFTAVATCLNNVGPGLELVCPMGSFAEFSAPVKLLLAFDMLAGRLELYPMLALFAPRLWRKRNYALRGARAK